MSPAWRATAVLIAPAAEWQQIEKETGDLAYLLSRYAGLVALIPGICGFLGACVIGVIVPGVGTVRAPVVDGLLGAIFGYMASIAVVLLLGLIANFLAPWFEGRRNFDNAFKLAVYSYTPVWLAGVFFLLPGLHFLVLTGFYGGYLLACGLPVLMGSPEQRTPTYAALILICACALTFAAAAAQRILFGQSWF